MRSRFTRTPSKAKGKRPTSTPASFIVTGRSSESRRTRLHTHVVGSEVSDEAKVGDHRLSHSHRHQITYLLLEGQGNCVGPALWMLQTTLQRNLLYLILFHCIYQSCTLEDDMEDLLDTTNEEMDMKPLKLIAEAKARSGDACGFWSGRAVIFDVQCSIMNHVVEPKYSIIFNQVNINLGKAYSRHTGKFRSPVRGIYFFSYSSLPFRGLHTDVALMKNGQKISLIHSVLSTGSSQLAVKNAILKLNRGDRVWVKLEKGKLWSRDGSISFQGFLLTPLC